jgi:hypothetical protein
MFNPRQTNQKSLEAIVLLSVSDAEFGGISPPKINFKQYVYILKCSDGSTYTGCTQNNEERLLRHSNRHVIQVL